MLLVLLIFEILEHRFQGQFGWRRVTSLEDQGVHSWGFKILKVIIWCYSLRWSNWFLSLLLKMNRIVVLVAWNWLSKSNFWWIIRDILYHLRSFLSENILSIMIDHVLNFLRWITALQYHGALELSSFPEHLVRPPRPIILVEYCRWLVLVVIVIRGSFLNWSLCDLHS